jgi:hypothetical protein
VRDLDIDQRRQRERRVKLDEATLKERRRHSRVVGTPSHTRIVRARGVPVNAGCPDVDSRP